MSETHGRSPVIVVSIDGVAPRSISPERTPTICSVARSGAGCFTGTTVTPPITLPAHTSILRSVPPDTHGILDNEPQPLDNTAPSFLQAARNGGCTTSAIVSWRPLDSVIEPTATTVRIVLDGGYGPGDDRFVTDAACDQFARGQHDVTFIYLTAPDLAGHTHGWDHGEYHAAVHQADAMLGEIVAAADDRSSILVTTDHGGSGKDHATTDADTMQIFVAARSPLLDAGGCWETFSPVDIAPTVAHLAGFEPHPDWQGTSLLGKAVPLVDHICAMLTELEQHAYGESVNMAEHSLQTAERLRSDGAGDALVLAGLLHDIGHLLGESGQFGYADHATSAARFLQPWFPAEVVEPIRLHVEAKRYLVATEPDYADELSAASVETLRQQGGPHTPTEAAAFADLPMANEAIRLRRADEAGKVAGQPTAAIEDFRELIESQLR